MESTDKINWQFSALPLNTRRALELLSKQAWLKKTKWYLAGGTALALQVGHRRSVDLDFFSPQTDFSQSQLIKKLEKLGWRTTLLREGTLYGELNGAKVSFIAYPFFKPAEKFLPFGAVKVLDKKDVAVMKIIAISQRGRKRDFFDLYWYTKHEEPIINVIRRLSKQYPKVAHDFYHITKSLTYFIDADEDPMPRLFFTASWREVKKIFEKETKRVAEELFL